MENQKAGCGYGGGYMVKIVGIVAVASVLGLAVVKDSIWTQNYDIVTVVGQGRVPVTPDAALVNLGVLTIREDTADIALQKTSEALKRVDSALEQAGIPKENRQITGYVLNPRYKETPPTPDGTAKAPEIDGYSASQQITVLISGIQNDAQRVNDVVVLATKAGANQVGEVKMIATNAEDLKQQARLKAVSDAKQKVHDIASASGVRVTSVSSWYETLLATPGSAYGNNIPSDNATQVLPVVPSSIIVLQPGQLDVVVELSMNYRIEN
jgi:uncharacterized protein YggE